jgi:hypothetical protein
MPAAEYRGIGEIEGQTQLESALGAPSTATCASDALAPPAIVDADESAAFCVSSVGAEDMVIVLSREAFPSTLPRTPPQQPTQTAIYG